MGRRSEHRIAVCLPVIVRGVDRRGKPFTQTAQTHDIGASGARLEGLECIDRAGGEIEVEYRGKKALYRVEWVGDASGPLAGHVGLRCLEFGKYIWGVPLAATAADEYDPHAPQGAAPEPPAKPPDGVTVPWAGNERRQLPRIACRLEAQLGVAGEPCRLPATVTDISLGGCYLEMLSPLPLASAVEIAIRLDAGTIQARGRVCSSHPGMGMGISFTGMSPQDLKQLRQFVPPPGATEPTSAQPAARGSSLPAEARASSSPSKPAFTQPPPQPPPATTAQALEAIVRVLFRKGVLSSSELSEELERVKAGRS